ncbi:transglutaminase TgpA family protein [Bowmanella dokdonensis]|uniref:DUF3488 domain-containing transglutaminase family protein n=1 Tax=Bowmanella dokdonensis TaxID=751969 RepID=A0A939DLL3_9ALTE|nr:DUF3488 and transglutaminase-like domain-containing protein [Bowmanella dokdonensis]MBN7825003.1 DUF3488 domain-containing transglutaminase family protein [Bowmanella dokdonensis]
MPRLNPSAHNHAHLLLSLVLLVNAASLFEPLQLWILLLVLCAVIIRLSLFLNWQKHQLSVRTLNLLAVLSAIVLAYFGWQLGLLLGMLNLLVMASSLKLMLLASRRDYFQLISVQFFLIGTGLVFNQSIAFSMLYGLLTLLLLLSLAFHISPSSAWLQQSHRVGMLCLQALPIALLLFLVMPKLGPMWQMPTAKGTETGLSERVTPGDVAQLARSADLAFRATFDSIVPNTSQRYWRALTLEDFDGKSWQVHPYRQKLRERYRSAGLAFRPAIEGPSFDYQVIAEPTQQRWLFGLDIAISSDPQVWLSHDYQLVSRINLQSSLAYKVKSYFMAPLQEGIPELDNRLNLQVPAEGNPRTRELALQLRAEHVGDKAYLQAVKEVFTAGGFRYTLRPNPMPVDPVDQFLFEDKAGFCAHYASAAAYMLRLGGIPARMVTGYLGGEMRGDRYMSVYQYDAHAWVEWLSDQGWQRFDPTVLVSPLRLDYGLERAVAYEESFLLDTPLAGFRNIAWLNEFRLMLADMDYLWSRWVLGFSRENQQDMLKSLLGKLTPTRLALFGLALVLAIALLLGLYQLKHWLPDRSNPSAWYYKKALKLLAKQGLQRPSWQGPQDFNQEVAQRFPGKAARCFGQLTYHYMRMNYRPMSEQEQKASLSQLRRLVPQLKQALSEGGG